MIESGNRYSPDLAGLSISDYLDFLASQQAKETESVPLPALLLSTWRDILEWFEQRPAFEAIYLEAVRFVSVPHSRREITRRLKALSGRIYQEIAFPYLSSSFAKGSSADKSFVVLSPERTLLFWQKINPNSKLIKNPFGLDSLEVSTPDGLIIEDDRNKKRLYAVCEYTLCGERGEMLEDKYFKDKYYAFRQIKRRFHRLFAESNLLFVIPEGEDVPDEIRRREEVRISPLPLDRAEFSPLLAELYRRYRFPSSHLKLNIETATLSEIQQRAQEFHRRACQRREKGEPLTPEIEKYLSKVGPPRNN